MKVRPHFPLLAKVLSWLFLHLLTLALAFFVFVSWQLGLGLDSLLSGSAGERLRSFGDLVREEIRGTPRVRWNEMIRPLAEEREVIAGIVEAGESQFFPTKIPNNVIERMRAVLPPKPEPSPGHRRSNGFAPPPFGAPERLEPPERRLPGKGEDRNRGAAARPSSVPVFLLRGDGGDGYWAGIDLMMPAPPGQPRRHQLLLMRADGPAGSGMFFEFKPWLWGGLAVLALSLAFWAPFVWNITRYIRKLTAVADRIAAGKFGISLPQRGHDELGDLGRAIEAMAGRLDHLVSGQKRFLGDAAHELCAPLARLRTGLGILELKLGDGGRAQIASIETDAQELASLVEEILAFSRAGNRTPQKQLVSVEEIVREICAREAGERMLNIEIPQRVCVNADPLLLGRALGNLVRNARIHAGDGAHIVIKAVENGEFLEISVSDDGPGVAAEELSRLFEPFYRPDRSRNRDTGGCGLGLAIVRNAIESCGGEVRASLPFEGGFSVMIRLPSQEGDIIS